jgi:hypothetical protein
MADSPKKTLLKIEFTLLSEDQTEEYYHTRMKQDVKLSLYVLIWKLLQKGQFA